MSVATSSPTAALAAVGAVDAVDALFCVDTRATLVAVTRPTTPFVGRAAPLAQLGDALAAATTGRAGAVLLSGDAGVGKTRLLGELVAAAAGGGVRRLVGHCVDFGDAALPFLPFSEMFGRLAVEQPEVVDQVLAAHPAALRLLPARRRESTAGDDRVDRAAVFEAVAATFDHLAAAEPVLVVVEDVHWADQSTRDLLGFLLARLQQQRLLLVVSYRSDDLHRRHPLRRVVAEWTRLPQVVRLDLAPLAASEVATLVRAVRPDVADGSVDSIVARAGGNAFFAEELAVSAACGDGVPAELAELLLVRVDRLSDDARELARVLAVAGRPVGHDLVGAVSGQAPATLDAGLREAVDAHLVEARSGDAYAFRHALVGEAVADDLLPGERVRLHTAFATVLREHPELGSDAELARHARASHDLATAFAAGVRAGDEALGVGAPAEAARHYELALDVVDRVEGAAQVRPRAAVVLAAAEAQVSAGFPERAGALVEEQLARHEPLPVLTHAELLHQAAVVNYLLDDRLGARDLLDQATAVLAGTPPSAARAAVLGMQARVLDSLDQWRDAVRVAEQAVDVAARVVADPASADQAAAARQAGADADATLRTLRRRTGDPAEIIRGLEELARRAHEEGQQPVELRARHNLGTVRYEYGDLEAADRAWGEAVLVADRTGRRFSPYGTSARSLQALVRYELGRFDEALAGLVVPGAPPGAVPELAAVAALVHAARGDDDPIWPRATRAGWWRDPQVAVLGAAAEAEVLARVEGFAAGRDHLDDAIATIVDRWGELIFLARVRMAALGVGMAADAVAGLPSAERPEVVRWAGAHVEAARRTVCEAQPDTADLGPEGRAWAVRLEAEWARLRWLAGTGPDTARRHGGDPRGGDPRGEDPRGHASHGRGQDGHARQGTGQDGHARQGTGQDGHDPHGGRPSGEERLPDAAEHVELWTRTVEAFGYGARYEVARCQVRLAAARRAAGDVAGATVTAATARTTARELGARPLLAALATLAVPTRRADDRLAAVPTARERDVLQLIAEGRTNRQIARALFISEKTVSVHVSHVLAKLGAASRTEAATLARRSGLLD